MIYRRINTGVRTSLYDVEPEGGKGGNVVCCANSTRCSGNPTATVESYFNFDRKKQKRAWLIYDERNYWTVAMRQYPGPKRRAGPIEWLCVPVYVHRVRRKMSSGMRMHKDR